MNYIKLVDRVKQIDGVYKYTADLQYIADESVRVRKTKWIEIKLDRDSSEIAILLNRKAAHVTYFDQSS